MNRNGMRQPKQGSIYEANSETASVDTVPYESRPQFTRKTGCCGCCGGRPQPSQNSQMSRSKSSRARQSHAGQKPLPMPIPASMQSGGQAGSKSSNGVKGGSADKNNTAEDDDDGDDDDDDDDGEGDGDENVRPGDNGNIPSNRRMKKRGTLSRVGVCCKDCCKSCFSCIYQHNSLIGPAAFSFDCCCAYCLKSIPRAKYSSYATKIVYLIFLGIVTLFSTFFVITYNDDFFEKGGKGMAGFAPCVNEKGVLIKMAGWYRDCTGHSGYFMVYRIFLAAIIIFIFLAIFTIGVGSNQGSCRPGVHQGFWCCKLLVFFSLVIVCLTQINIGRDGLFDETMMYLGLVASFFFSIPQVVILLDLVEYVYVSLKTNKPKWFNYYYWPATVTIYLICLGFLILMGIFYTTRATKDGEDVVDYGDGTLCGSNIGLMVYAIIVGVATFAVTIVHQFKPTKLHPNASLLHASVVFLHTLVYVYEAMGNSPNVECRPVWYTYIETRNSRDVAFTLEGVLHVVSVWFLLIYLAIGDAPKALTAPLSRAATKICCIEPAEDSDEDDDVGREPFRTIVKKTGASDDLDAVVEESDAEDNNAKENPPTTYIKFKSNDLGETGSTSDARMTGSTVGKESTIDTRRAGSTSVNALNGMSSTNTNRTNGSIIKLPEGGDIEKGDISSQPSLEPAPPAPEKQGAVTATAPKKKKKPTWEPTASQSEVKKPGGKFYVKNDEMKKLQYSWPLWHGFLILGSLSIMMGITNFIHPRSEGPHASSVPAFWFKIFISPIGVAAYLVPICLSWGFYPKPPPITDVEKAADAEADEDIGDTSSSMIDGNEETQDSPPPEKIVVKQEEVIPQIHSVPRAINK